MKRLLAGVDAGLARARDVAGSVDAIGVDSWGLDYGLFDAAGRLTGAPCHYRHPRSQRGHDGCALPAEALFAVTAAQALPVNTVYQLSDEARHQPERHAGARLLMVADMVNRHLAGGFAAELTLARTSGLVDAGTGDWSGAICAGIGVDPGLLPPIVPAGTRLGGLRAALAEPLGWGPVPVIAVAAHDTASAVAALDLADGSGFLICGSWSLIGVERDRIDRRPAVLAAGFGNEGGLAGRSFLVRSLNGLHLVQKLRESWMRRSGEALDYAALSRAAAGSATAAAIDPGDAAFFNPPDMVAAIAGYCARTGQAVPGDAGGLARAVYNGLAAEAAAAVAALEGLIGEPLPGLRLCGGGARDALLCDLIAGATGKPVGVGPIEASAWGNALVQLIALGAVPSLEAGRRLVADATREAVAHAGG